MFVCKNVGLLIIKSIHTFYVHLFNYLFYYNCGQMEGAGRAGIFQVGNLQKSWANFSFFKKSYYHFFFEELLVCVCGYKVVYMCVGVRSTTLLQFKVENALLRISFFRFYWIGFQKLKKSFFSNFHTFSLSLKNVQQLYKPILLWCKNHTLFVLCQYRSERILLIFLFFASIFEIL